jgi:hypothetical protein
LAALSRTAIGAACRVECSACADSASAAVITSHVSTASGSKGVLACSQNRFVEQHTQSYHLLKYCSAAGGVQLHKSAFLWASTLCWQLAAAWLEVAACRGRLSSCQTPSSVSVTLTAVLHAMKYHAQAGSCTSHSAGLTRQQHCNGDTYPTAASDLHRMSAHTVLTHTEQRCTEPTRQVNALPCIYVLTESTEKPQTEQRYHQL